MATPLPCKTGLVRLLACLCLLMSIVLAAAQKTWQVEAANKLARTNAKIPASWRLTTENIAQGQKQHAFIGKQNLDKSIEDFIRTLPSNGKVSADLVINITSTDPGDLVQTMKNKTYSAVQVMTAFCIRASVIHQVHPVLLDVAFDEAIKKAQGLDKHLADTGTLQGPLHGLPFTMKDQYHAVGLETSGSFVGWFEANGKNIGPRTKNEILTIHATNFSANPKNVESDIVKKFTARGAVPIAKTSIMQSTWSVDTENNMVGYLTNPYNTQLTSGGSSGGEAVLQALGGSAFGIGEDSGGSVSMPCSLNGLYCFKPSSGYYFSNTTTGQLEIAPNTTRLTMENAVNFGTRLQATEVTCPGLIARSFRLIQQVYDSVLPSPAAPKQNFKFAYLDNDSVYTPHPPIQRALEEAKAALENLKGESSPEVTIEKYTGTSSSQVTSIHGTLARQDGIIDIYQYRNVTQEPFVPSLGAPIVQVPSPWNNEDQEAMNQAVALRDKYRKEYEDLFTANKYDALIMPTFASTAWQKGDGIDAVSYSTWANVLNVPTCAIRTTTASKAIDVKPESFTGMSQSDAALMSLYDPEAVDGLPISLMILGRKDREHELLDAVAFLQKIVLK